VYLRSKDDERRRPRRKPHDRCHCPLLRRVRLNVWIVGLDHPLQCYQGFHVGQERELETVSWGDGLNGLVFSARDNTVVFETNVEAFVLVASLKSSPETEANFIPFNRMHESRVPLSLGCSRGLNEDLVADQHAGALLRQTRDRKASETVNLSPRLGGKNTYKWRGCRYSILASGMSNFSRSRLCTC